MTRKIKGDPFDRDRGRWLLSAPVTHQHQGCSRSRIDLALWRLHRPEAERRYPGEVLEIPVRAQHDELVADAESGQERIDRADLEAAAATVVAKVCRGRVIFALGHEERQWSEAVQDLLSRFRAAESLQDLLKNQACGEDRSCVPKNVCRKSTLGWPSL